MDSWTVEEGAKLAGVTLDQGLRATAMVSSVRESAGRSGARKGSTPIHAFSVFAQEPALSEETCQRLRALAPDQDRLEPCVFTKRLHPLWIDPPAVDWIFVIRPRHWASGDDVATRTTNASKLSIPSPDFANVLDHLAGKHDIEGRVRQWERVFARCDMVHLWSLFVVPLDLYGFPTKPSAETDSRWLDGIASGPISRMVWFARMKDTPYFLKRSLLLECIEWADYRA